MSSPWIVKTNRDEEFKFPYYSYERMSNCVLELLEKGRKVTVSDRPVVAWGQTWMYEDRRRITLYSNN
jgi:hypothetical protein